MYLWAALIAFVLLIFKHIAALSSAPVASTTQPEPTKPAKPTPAQRKQWTKGAFEKLSLYEVLEVEQTFDAEGLKRAYKQKMLEHHPDKNLDDPQAAKARFERVKEAYETLSDTAKRANYDYMRTQPRYNASASSGSAPHPDHWQSYQSQGASSSSTPGNTTSWFDPWRFRVSSKYPEPVARLMPDRYMFQSPRAYGERSITPADIAMWWDAFNMQVLARTSGDTPEDYFTPLAGLFESLAYDERQHGSPAHLPQFGDHYDSWCWDDDAYRNQWSPWRDSRFAKNFYEAWEKFETSKTFYWVNVVELTGQDWFNPGLRAFAEAQNLAARIQIIEAYNNTIRQLVSVVRSSDLREIRYSFVQRGVLVKGSYGRRDGQSRYHSSYDYYEFHRHHQPRNAAPAAKSQGHNPKQNNKKKKKKKGKKRY